MHFALRAALVLGCLAPAATSQTCVQPLPNLRIWWDADDVKWERWHLKYGPYALDSTNRIDGPALLIQNHDVNAGPWVPQFAPGMVGQAFSFDPAHPSRASLRMIGPSATDPVPHPETMFTTRLSIELWMKWNPSASYIRTTFGLVDQSVAGEYYETDAGFGLWGYTSTGQLYFRIGKGGGQVVEVWGATNVKDGAWHHVVATFDASLASGNQKLYVDGALEGSTDNSSPIAPTSESIAIGRSPVYGNFAGLIDEVMLYDRALTAAEVDAGYHSPGRCRPVYPARPNSSGELEYPSLLYGNGLGSDMDLDGDVLALTDPGAGTRVFRRSGASWTAEQFLVPALGPYGGSTPAGICAVSGNVLVQTVLHGASVWRFNGASWVEEQFLSVHGINPGGGWAFPSVDISGDTIVVGGGPSNYVNPGAQIFRHDGSQWVQEAVLSGSGGFGLPVAIDGDLLAVGAHTAGLVGTRSGALHLFRRTGTSWNQIALVTPDQLEPGRPSYEYFSLGRQVDVDGDRVLVGAMGAVSYNLAGYESTWIGSAYVLDASSGSVTLESKLPCSMPAYAFGGYSWGRSVRLEGELAVVGAFRDGSPITERMASDLSGSALVYARQGGVWREVGKCRASIDIHFGMSVEIDGSRVLANVLQEDHPRPRVFFFEFEGATNPTRPIANAGADLAVAEGAAVSLDGSASFDGDGDALSYHWAQVAGPTVTLSGADTVSPSFNAPSVGAGGTTLTFVLLVDDGELESDPDHMDVSVANLNHPPIAEAGADQVVAEGSPVSLSGLDSYDVDNEELAYSWTQTGGPTVSLSGADTMTMSFTAPLVGSAGTLLSFELVVNDGLAASAPDAVLVSVTNVNNDPVASAGAPTTVDEGSLAFLDGSASVDPDGDVLSYSWTQIGGPAVSLSNPFTQIPTFTAPDVSGVAELGFELVVSDGFGGVSAPATTTVTVRDTNAAPSCAQAAPSKPLLWPPNHKMVAVRVVGVSDPDDGSIEITILGVRQDEPTNNLGDGDTGPADAVIQGDTVLLRAERSGLGDGRTYHILFQARDAAGGTCTGSITVGVPHDKKSPVIDGGPLHDSTG